MFNVVGGINGLVCLAAYTYTNTNTIIIWNPSIRKSITLPRPSSTCYNHGSFGFGFDSCSNDYKVLRIAQPFRRDEDEAEEQEHEKDLEIYSLNMNSWKRICAPRYKFPNHHRQVFVNGVMHVVAYTGHKMDRYHNLILGFNIGDEVFKEIALPQSLVDEYPVFLHILAYNESIAVLEEESFIGPGGIHVWVMEEYGVVESWTKRIFSFNGQEFYLPWVLGFRKNGELILELYGGGERLSCALESREIKHLEVHGSNTFENYFVESMHLLDNANAQSDPTVENDAIGDAAGDATGAND